jgi:hypothetical protein
MDNKVTKTVEKFTLEDGRMAERHITLNPAGEKVVEVFVQEKLPLKLEKRITEKKKEVVHEQKVETIKDGEVVEVKVLSTEPNVKMELREHIAKTDKSEIGALNYATKKDLIDVVTQAVVAGVAAAKPQQVAVQQPAPAPKPLFRAQSVVEENVAAKKKNDALWIGVMVIALIAQVGFFGYLLFGQ